MPIKLRTQAHTYLASKTIQAEQTENSFVPGTPLEKCPVNGRGREGESFYLHLSIFINLSLGPLRDDTFSACRKLRPLPKAAETERAKY